MYHSPTQQLYSAIELMYDHFNGVLFDNMLPSVVLTVQKQKRIMGYFSPSSWASSEGQNCHEIAINPEYIATFPLIEVMQTLVHEQAHCWQFCFGKPSRGGYHNREWSNKMLSVGLVPSSTGKPGGKLVGQNMNDYPEPNGKFTSACEALVTTKGFSLPWVAISGVVVNQHPDTIVECSNEHVQALLEKPIFEAIGIDIQVTEKPKSKQKTKYRCHKCLVNVWGKAGLNIVCDDCKLPFLAQED